MTFFGGCCPVFRNGRIHGQCGAVTRKLPHLGRSQKLADSLHHSAGIVATSSLTPLVELFGEVGGGLPGKRRVGGPKTLPVGAVATAACGKAACRITARPERRDSRTESGRVAPSKRRIIERHRRLGIGVQLLGDPAHLLMPPTAIGISDHLPLEIAGIEPGQPRRVGTVASAIEAMTSGASVCGAGSAPAERDQFARRLEAVAGGGFGRGASADHEQRDKKKAAGHGAATRAVAIWFLPMLLLAACKPPPEQRMQMPQADAAHGKRIIERVGCASCHGIAGIDWPKGKVGPPLNGLSERALIAGRLPNRPDVLAAYIRDAPALVPNSGMPAMPVSETEARDIAAYLYEQGNQ